MAMTAAQKKSYNERLRQPAQLCPDLPACPFCGSPPEMEFWHGGKPTKRMIACSGDDCEVNPMVTGETEREAIKHWSRRTP